MFSLRPPLDNEERDALTERRRVLPLEEKAVYHIDARKFR